MRALVTGGSGFVGGHLVRALLARGYTVRALVRPTSRTDGLAGAELVYGDVTDQASCQAAVVGVDVVYHLAAIRDRWGTPYADYVAVNVDGTRHLLEAAAGRVGRFVYCSSVGVLGYPGVLGIDESFPLRPDDGKVFYHRTKAQAEELVLDFARQGRLATTVVRPAITYGPGDDWGMVTRLIAMLRRGTFVPVGNGRNHLHLCYVSDTVQGLILAGESEQSVGQAYIIAGPEPITLNGLVVKICGLLERKPPRWHVPVELARMAGWVLEGVYSAQAHLGLRVLGQAPFLTRDKVDTLAVNRGFSIEKARHELGYVPAIGYDEGLRRTVEWYCNEDEYDER
ncbi:MAG: NAD-dependent epimerase/dehydratase family protein [Anaerolineae bacterium]|nr:NAD-dependent epimerase/dehydratase family protein [Anaerolineae bacterium]